MSKKHFEAVARQFRREYEKLKGCKELSRTEPERYASALFGFRRAVYAFCDAAKEANPRFNFSLFIDACGIVEEEAK